MGKVGRKPKPVQILKLTGAYREDRHAGRGVGLAAETPDCPESLQGEGRVEWNRLIPRLASIGMLTVADRALLVEYCQIWHDLEDAESLCRDADGKLIATIKTIQGNVIVNPALGVRNTLRKQLRDYAADLGFSPVARASVTAAGPPSETDKLAEILARFAPKPRKPKAKKGIPDAENRRVG